jgi:FixJ family two-component response regulator
MVEQHVYVLSHNDQLVKALNDAGVPSTRFAKGSDLQAQLAQQPRGVLVVDLQLPGAAGYSFLRDASGGGALPTIVLAAEGDVAAAVEGMRHNAVDVIEDPYDHRNAVARVRAALKKEADSWDQRRRTLAVAHRLESLTPREAEVFGQLSLGMSNRETGEILKISPRTVEVHRGRIMGKMGAKSMTSLVRMVVEAGLGHTLPRLPNKP